MGFDPDELYARLAAMESRLEESSKILQSLKEDLDKLKESKADVKYVQSIEEQLSNLDNLINSMIKVIGTRRRDKKVEIDVSTSDKHQLVLELIRKGVNTSSELRKHVSFSVRELYEILNDLEKLSMIGHIKEGRKKRYYVIEADDEFVQSGQFL